MKAFGLLILITIVVAGCSGSGSQGDPRDTVIAMFGAMERNDEALLVRLLDIPELMRQTDVDYALGAGDGRTFRSPTEIVADLTGDGLTKQRWFAHQRIVGATEFTAEDQATVEVTFIDDNQRAYLTKFGLQMKNDRWQIYTFRSAGAGS